MLSRAVLAVPGCAQGEPGQSVTLCPSLPAAGVSPLPCTARRQGQARHRPALHEVRIPALASAVHPRGLQQVPRDMCIVGSSAGSRAFPVLVFMRQSK